MSASWFHVKGRLHFTVVPDTAHNLVSLCGRVWLRDEGVFRLSALGSFSTYGKVCKRCRAIAEKRGILDVWSLPTLKAAYNEIGEITRPWPKVGPDEEFFTSWACPACGKETKLWNYPGCVSIRDVCSPECFALLGLRYGICNPLDS